jgi:hypothetical protein
MTPAAGPAYIAAVLMLYLDLPETPLRFNANDQRTAQRLYEQGVSMEVVEAALLLGSLRRLSRDPSMPPLAPIRSLAYFQPVITELQNPPVPNCYLEYLRRKIRQFQPVPSDVQKTTFSSDR